MKGLLGIMALGFMIIMVTNSAYAMESMEGAERVGVVEMESAEAGLKMIAAPLYVDADDPVGAMVPPGGVNDGVGKFLFTQTGVLGTFISDLALVML